MLTAIVFGLACVSVWVATRVSERINVAVLVLDKIDYTLGLKRYDWQISVAGIVLAFMRKLRDVQRERAVRAEEPHEIHDEIGRLSLRPRLESVDGRGRKGQGRLLLEAHRIGARRQ